MKIGDKVRLLRGTEEGYIKAIKGNIIDVEIEDGFVIPTPKNQIVLVNRREAEIFKKEDVAATAKPAFTKSSLPSGLHIGIAKSIDQRLEILFINQTADTVLFTVNHYEKKVFYSLLAGICQPFSINDTGESLRMVTDGLVKLHIQVIISQTQTKLPSRPLEIEQEFRVEHLKFSTFVEQAMKDVHLFKLDAPAQLVIDSERLRESMSEGPAARQPAKEPLKRTAEQIVDLHIDQLSENLKEHEVYSYQIEMFEKAYDRALISNVEKLKIIHGIGSGKLRAEIHKRLTIRKDVRYFEDADKERFGYGATVIYL